ncbi:hypothetical protein RB195_003165 [Necator americanus]|uniref:Uncharacterized protein n=1 Tax=Necator americanus TaxID=51031 RepID=A0ABR1DNN4_NECAM
MQESSPFLISVEEVVSNTSTDGPPTSSPLELPPLGGHQDRPTPSSTTSSEMFVDVAGDVAGGGLRFPLSIRRSQFSTTPMLTISLRRHAHSSRATAAYDAAT